jgi:hypothetical protein
MDIGTMYLQQESLDKIIDYEGEDEKSSTET